MTYVERVANPPLSKTEYALFRIALVASLGAEYGKKFAILTQQKKDAEKDILIETMQITGGADKLTSLIESVVFSIYKSHIEVNKKRNDSGYFERFMGSALTDAPRGAELRKALGISGKKCDIDYLENAYVEGLRTAGECIKAVMECKKVKSHEQE